MSEETGIRKSALEKPERERLYFLRPHYILLLSWIPLAAGFASGVKWLLPLMITIPSFLVMCRWIYKRRIFAAYGEMLLSCLWMSIAFIILCLWFPMRADTVIIRGPEYVVDMEEWIDTGGATEGTPALFIPEHLEHMGIVAAASIATGGFLALYFGAIQMGYMNYYVAWLLKASGYDPWAFGLCWPVWSIIRVLSFVLLAVVLAQPLLYLFKWKNFSVRRMLWLIVAAVILEGIDILLKTLLGPHNQDVLNVIVEKTYYDAAVFAAHAAHIIG